MTLHRHHLAVALLGAALTCVQATGTAQADPVCTYDPATRAVNALVDAESVATVVEPDPSTRAILFDRVQCGGATLDNTDRVTVLGAGGRVSFWAHDAGFETTKLAAVGFGTVYYSAPEHVPATITAGKAGIDLDGDRRIDLTYGGATEIDIDGSSGGDVVSALGGGKTGGQLAADVVFSYGQGSDAVGGLPMTVRGHDGVDYLAATDCTTAQVWGYAGDDQLVGCLGPTLLHGGKGNDRLLLRGDGSSAYGDTGNDTLLGMDGGIDTLDGGRGHDAAFAESWDLLTSIETLS